ncbi:MAG: glycoside hydrolase family 9 protein [Flavobacteriales bacterium]
MRTLLSIPLLCSAAFLRAQTGTETDRIAVDQFGYRTSDEKIAVISDPQLGYNASDSYTPGATLEVREWGSNTVLFSAAPIPWNGGQQHDQSGDVIWWFDFSTVSTTASCYVYDPANNTRSHRFEIDDCVYNEVLQTALRAFYYQRCGTAKPAAYAGVGWSDAAPCHVGTGQDVNCRLVTNPLPANERDLHGGWHDAGDHNKYVNWTYSVLSDLLLAYEENPAVWGDDSGIPESGNGVPDILDEAKYELDWLLRMRYPDGSVIGKVAVTTSSSGPTGPPSADVNVRRHSGVSTSATFTVAALCALASIQFDAVGETTYAQTLRDAAITSYDWAVANPNVLSTNNGLVNPDPELGTYDTEMRHLAAALYLYAATGTNSYRSYFNAYYTDAHLLQWGYAYPFEATDQDMLLYYANCAAPTAAVLNTIQNAYATSMNANNADNLPAYLNGTDAYGAYMASNNYTWGSNTTKGHQGSMFTSMNTYGLDGTNAASYANAAAGFVHYFHGVNPNNTAYLTNMAAFGAERSVNSIYHGWFEDGSALWDEAGVSTYGPAPGFVPGGPNPTYDWDGCCPTNCGSAQNNALCFAESIEPPKNQPTQKSWKDFNTSWPLNSWTVTEIGIYTQAAYVRMLSHFATPGCVITSVSPPSPSSRHGLSAFPDPAQDLLNVEYIDAGAIDIRVQVVDARGRTALTGTIPRGIGRATLDISQLAGGPYLLRASSGTGAWTSMHFVKL